jgi:hypothetical protein
LHSLQFTLTASVTILEVVLVLWTLFSFLLWSLPLFLIGELRGNHLAGFVVVVADQAAVSDDQIVASKNQVNQLVGHDYLGCGIVFDRNSVAYPQRMW